MGHVPPIILLRVMTPITGRLGTFSVCQKMSKIKFVPHALIQAQNAPKPFSTLALAQTANGVGSLQRTPDPVVS